MLEFLDGLKLPGIVLFLLVTVWIVGWERNLAGQVNRNVLAAPAHHQCDPSPCDLDEDGELMLADR